jgi:hypothetical protein
MKLNPLHVRQERRAQELVDVQAFRAVRRVAGQELRDLASVAPSSAEVAALRSALEATTTAEEVVALEPLVRRAASQLRVEMPADRTVLIADRWVPWGDVGASYEGVVAASRAAEVGPTSVQRDRGVRRARWKDEERPRI